METTFVKGSVTLYPLPNAWQLLNALFDAIPKNETAGLDYSKTASAFLGQIAVIPADGRYVLLKSLMDHCQVGGGHNGLKTIYLSLMLDALHTGKGDAAEFYNSYAGTFLRTSWDSSVDVSFPILDTLSNSFGLVSNSTVGAIEKQALDKLENPQGTIDIANLVATDEGMTGKKDGDCVSYFSSAGGVAGFVFGWIAAGGATVETFGLAAVGAASIATAFGFMGKETGNMGAMLICPDEKPAPVQAPSVIIVSETEGDRNKEDDQKNGEQDGSINQTQENDEPEAVVTNEDDKNTPTEKPDSGNATPNPDSDSGYGGGQPIDPKAYGAIIVDAFILDPNSITIDNQKGFISYAGLFPSLNASGTKVLSKGALLKNAHLSIAVPSDGPGMVPGKYKLSDKIAVEAMQNSSRNIQLQLKQFNLR